MKSILCLISILTLGVSAHAQNTSDENKKINTLKVEISEGGMSPSSIKVKKGEELVLFITRKTDNTCTKELKYLDGSGFVNLPLNKEVEFKIGRIAKTGEVKLLCGMDMTVGTITVI